MSQYIVWCLQQPSKVDKVKISISTVEMKKLEPRMGK